MTDLREWFGTKDGHPGGYLVRFSFAEGRTPPTLVDFAICPVVALTMDGGREFYADPSLEMSEGLTSDLSSAQPECSGFVKRDGCTQIYFTVKDGPALHFDDADDLRLFLDCLAFARSRSLELMETSE